MWILTLLIPLAIMEMIFGLFTKEDRKNSK